MELIIDSFETLWVSSDSTKLAVELNSYYTTEGTYCNKVIGSSASGCTLSLTLTNSVDLNQYDKIGFNLKSNLKAISGSTDDPVFLKFGFSNDSYTYTEFNIPISNTSYPEHIYFDISVISKSLRNNVKYFTFTVLTNDDFTIYLDELICYKVELFYDVEKKLRDLLTQIKINDSYIKVKFQGSQSMEEIPFPCVSVSLLDIIPSFNRMAEEEEVILNETATGNRIYDMPTAWNIQYDIMTFSNKNIDDRQIQEQLLRLLPPRGYLSIRGKVHPCTYIGMTNLDDFSEEKIYSKVFTYEIETRADFTYLRSEKLVLEVLKNYRSIDGEIV